MLAFELLVRERVAGLLGGGVVEFREDADDLDTACGTSRAGHEMRLLVRRRPDGCRRRGHADLDEPVVRKMSVVHVASPWSPREGVSPAACASVEWRGTDVRA